MGQKQTNSNGGDDRNVDLIEFSVVLVATSNNPSILNPDFLRYNGIVDANRQVQEPCISTHAYSQVTFKGGLAVKADPDRVIFEQRGDKLAIEDIVCPEMAKRYLEKVPHVPYRAVGINPKGYRLSEGKAADRVADALIDKGSWMSFKDIIPDIQLKAIYRYDKRIIFLDITERRHRQTDDIRLPGMLFQANIHRNIQETNPIKRIEIISSIFSSWKDDLFDFYAVVAKFNPNQ